MREISWYIQSKCCIYKNWYLILETEGKSRISLIWRSLTGLPFSDNFMQTTPPRQKTWCTFSYFWRSLHLTHEKREADTKTWHIDAIRFLSFNKASAFFRLKILTITFYCDFYYSLREGVSDIPQYLEPWHLLLILCRFLLSYSPDLHQKCCSVCLIAVDYYFRYTAPISSDFSSNLLIFSSNL